MCVHSLPPWSNRYGWWKRHPKQPPGMYKTLVYTVGKTTYQFGAGFLPSTLHIYLIIFPFPMPLLGKPFSWRAAFDWWKVPPVLWLREGIQIGTHWCLGISMDKWSIKWSILKHQKSMTQTYCNLPSFNTCVRMYDLEGKQHTYSCSSQIV